MTLPDLLLLLVLPVAVGVSAFCSASETALFSLTFSDRTRLNRTSPRVAAAINRLLARPRTLLLSVLLLTNLANVLYFLAGSILERRLPGHTLRIALNLVSLLALIFLADLLPKLLARSRRTEFCRALARPLLLLLRVLGPTTAVLERIVVDPFLRLILPHRPDRERHVTQEELATLLDLSARAGEIEADEQQLLGDVVELGTIRVRDIMTPRVSMTWLPETATPAQVIDAARNSGANRIPVFRGSIEGRPLGLLDLKRYLPALEAAGPGTKLRVSAFLVPAVFVPERAKLDQLLDLFRANRLDVALCVEELGAAVGVVRIGDVVDELLRRGIESGGDPAEQVTRVGPDRWLIPGRLSVRELWEYFFGPGRGPAIDRRASTVAGLIFARLGRVPRVGDAIRLGNVLLTVHAMNGRVVDRVAASVARPDSAEQVAPESPRQEARP
jgi:CBS domain containing-hemolysin-like protein